MFFSSAIGVGPSGVHVPPVMTFGATGDRGTVRLTDSNPPLASTFGIWCGRGCAASETELFPSPASGGWLGWEPAANAGQIDPSASVDARTRKARRLGNSGSIMRRRNAPNILPPPVAGEARGGGYKRREADHGRIGSAAETSRAGPGGEETGGWVREARRQPGTGGPPQHIEATRSTGETCRHAIEREST